MANSTIANPSRAAAIALFAIAALHWPDARAQNSREKNSEPGEGATSEGDSNTSSRDDQAAEDPDADKFAYETTVVGSRTEGPHADQPLTVSTLSLRPLTSTGPGLSLGEQTVDIPGLVIRNRDNYAQDIRLSLRGFGARSAFGIRGVTVVLDGIPLTMPDGLAQVDLVDPELLGRIEVLRGPAGALYGNAAGGVINLQTAAGDSRPGAEVTFRVGEYGLRKHIARVAQEFSSGSVSVAASSLKTDGYRDHARAKQRILIAAGSWRASRRTDIRLSAGYVDAPIAQDPGGLSREEMDENPRQAAANNLRFDTGEAVSQAQFGAALRTQISDREALQVSAYHVGRGFTGRIPFRVVDLDRNAVGSAIHLHSERTLGAMPVASTLAIEGSRLDDRRLSFASEGGARGPEPDLHQVERVRSLAGYAQAQLALRPWIHVSAGGRYDRIRVGLDDLRIVDGDDSDQRDFGAATGMAGFLVRVAPRAEVYMNLADAFEIPTVSELSLRPDAEPGISSELAPQRARNYELGSRYGRGRLTSELVAFYTSLQDELVPFEDATQRTFYRNAGRSHRQGVELASGLRLPFQLELSLSYSYLLAVFDEYVVEGEDLRGNRVPGLPRHRLTNSLRWAANDSGPFAVATLEYLHGMFADDANRHRSSAQRPITFQGGYRGRWQDLRYSVRGGVQNLVDESHIDNLRINALGNRFYEPGAPRFFYLSASLGWAADSSSGN